MPPEFNGSKGLCSDVSLGKGLGKFPDLSMIAFDIIFGQTMSLQRVRVTKSEVNEWADAKRTRGGGGDLLEEKEVTFAHCQKEYHEDE